MEWCGKLYEEWRTAEILRRLERTALVLLIFVMIVEGVCGTETAISLSGRDHAGYHPETRGETASIPGLPAIPATDTAEGTPASSDILDISREMTETESLAQEIPAEAIPAGPVEEAGTYPAEPEYPAETVPPISVPDKEHPAESVPPATVPEEETPAGTVPAVVEGFLVDEHGMICGIEDLSVIMDGYVVLPSEGCSGIAAGAFSNVPTVISEIYIPANVTHIEPGAFCGLADLEWLEAEGSDSCYTEDGVLFSENGTCILGFPSARTGNYKVPGNVTRFAEHVFDDAKIEIIDAVGCTLEDTGSLPSSIRLLLTEDLKG